MAKQYSSDQANIKNQQLPPPRSEAVNEIIGKPPSYLLQFGNLLLFIVFIVLCIVGFNARYPDIVSTKLTLTTVNPAERLLAPRDVTVDQILVKSGDSIPGGAVIMVFRSLASFAHVLALEDILLSVQSPSPSDSAIAALDIPTFLELGNIQEQLYNFEENKEAYLAIRDKKLSGLTIKEIQKRIREQKGQIIAEKEQQDALAKEVSIASRELERQQNFLNNGLVEEAQVQLAQQSLGRSQRLLKSTGRRIRELRFNIELLENQLISSQSSEEDDLFKKARNMRESFSLLIRAVEEWKQINLLTAPKSGIIIPNIDVREKQRFAAGSILASLLPLQPEGILGRIDLPLQRSGKVKIGQRVLIKFINYPYEEFGAVEGIVKEKSPIPSDEVIPILVDFPNGMVTNTGNPLEPVQFMIGDAEIIVGERRLLAWLLDR